MKRLAVTFAVFTMICAVTLVSYISLNHIHNDMLTQIESCAQAALTDECTDETRMISDLWNRYEPIVVTFVKHEHVESISVGIKMLSGYEKTANYDMYLAECENIKESLSHIIKGDRLSFQILI